jgi:hypothetical protein
MVSRQRGICPLKFCRPDRDATAVSYRTALGGDDAELHDAAVAAVKAMEAVDG